MVNGATDDVSELDSMHKTPPVLRENDTLHDVRAAIPNPLIMHHFVVVMFRSRPRHAMCMYSRCSALIVRLLERHCVCVCVCVRARVCVCMCVCVCARVGA